MSQQRQSINVIINHFIFFKAIEMHFSFFLLFNDSVFCKLCVEFRKQKQNKQQKKENSCEPDQWIFQSGIQNNVSFRFVTKIFWNSTLSWWTKKYGNVMIKRNIFQRNVTIQRNNYCHIFNVTKRNVIRTINFPITCLLWEPKSSRFRGH